MTNTMQERERTLGRVWYAEGEGFFSMVGAVFGTVCYIALPKNHPAIGKSYDDLCPDVNGGLTFAEENVFGWDYSHASNHNDVSGDVERALKYFKEMENVPA